MKNQNKWYDIGNPDYDYEKINWIIVKRYIIIIKGKKIKVKILKI